MTDEKAVANTLDDLPPELLEQLQDWEGEAQLEDFVEIELLEQKRGLGNTVLFAASHFFFPLIGEGYAWYKSEHPEGANFHRKNTLWLGALTLGIGTWLCFDAKSPLIFDSAAINFLQEKLDLGSLSGHEEAGTALLYFGLITLASYIVRGLVTYHSFKNSVDDHFKDNAAKYAAQYTFLGEKPSPSISPEVTGQKINPIAEISEGAGIKTDMDKDDDNGSLRSAETTSSEAFHKTFNPFTPFTDGDNDNTYYASRDTTTVRIKAETGMIPGRARPVPLSDIYNNLVSHYVTTTQNKDILLSYKLRQRASAAATAKMNSCGFTFDDVSNQWTRSQVSESESPHTEGSTSSSTSRSGTPPTPLTPN
jgi:hypothetical protein